MDILVLCLGVCTLAWLLAVTFSEDQDPANLPLPLRIPAVILMLPAGIAIHALSYLVDLVVAGLYGDWDGARRLIGFYREDWTNLPSEVLDTLRGVPHD